MRVVSTTSRARASLRPSVGMWSWSIDGCREALNGLAAFSYIQRCVCAILAELSCQQRFFFAFAFRFADESGSIFSYTVANRGPHRGHDALALSERRMPPGWKSVSSSFTLPDL